MRTGSPRPIRSYVLREGRMTEAQKRAYEKLAPSLCVPFSHSLLDLQRLFGRAGPKLMEIGFGMGETTAEIAVANPDCDYLAVEVHTPGVGSLLRRIAVDDIRNIRIVQHDAVEVLQHMIAPGSLDGVHLFFPDPWPKKRHHKRRLVQPAFAALLAERTRPGGRLHAATDWEDYARQLEAVFSAEPRLEKSDATHPRPRTRFERRGLKLGLRVWDFHFRRKEDLE
jgi:tRNA (guanine-N7-)-methyltransferase